MSDRVIESLKARISARREVMTPEVLRDRSKLFAYRILRLFRSLPRTFEAQVAGKQLLRSGSSVAANYRAVCRARSQAEFIAKIGVVLEEADESVFWLEFLADNSIVSAAKIGPLLTEARELTAIFAASQRTARRSSNDPIAQ